MDKEQKAKHLFAEKEYSLVGGLTMLSVTSVKSDKLPFLNVKKWNIGMKTEYSKNLTKMTLKCEVSFLKCDKCEVTYSW